MKLLPIIAYVAVAALSSYGAGFAVDALAVSPLVANAPVVLVLAIFAWFRRDYELVDVVVPAFIISYVGYAGIAVARVTHTLIYPLVVFHGVHGRFSELRPLNEQWLLVLAAGLPYALVLTVGVAFPVSMIPLRPKAGVRDDTLGRFIEAQHAQRNASNDPP
jgi:hypothetical protein